MSVRLVKRLYAVCKVRGAAGLVSRSSGSAVPSNRRTPAEVRGSAWAWPGSGTLCSSLRARGPRRPTRNSLRHGVPVSLSAMSAGILRAERTEILLRDWVRDDNPKAMFPKPSQWFCPFDSALSPLTDAAVARTVAWAETFALAVEHDAVAQFTGLVSRFYPAADAERFQLISDWTTWLFVHDDVCDETETGRSQRALAETFDHFFNTLCGEAPLERPFDRALADLRNRFYTLAPSRTWTTRFLNAVRDYFDACIWEAHNREVGAIPGVGKYISMRRLASDMFSYIEFIDFANNETTPVWVRRQRDVEMLCAITNNVASWTNDVFSARKEMAQGDPHNLVLVLQHEHSCSRAEAVELALNYCNKEVLRFLDVRARAVQSERSLASSPYIAGLETLMRGNLDWSLETRRYNQG
jgi:5-epi-alpha-selinene synthase